MKLIKNNLVQLLKTILLVVLVMGGHHSVMFEISREKPSLADDLLNDKVVESEDIYLFKQDQQINDGNEFPLIKSSTYFGGSNNDYLHDIDIDSKGNILLGGSTNSPNFPVVNAFNLTLGGVDGFFAKYVPHQQKLTFSSYFGGSYIDHITEVAVDSNGNVIICGQTLSYDLPVNNAFNATYGGSIDIFLAKFSADGQVLLFSTYFGGSKQDEVTSMTIDATGNIYIAGFTDSPDLPMVNSYQSEIIPQYIFPNGYLYAREAFFAKFSPEGELIFSTYFGGLEDDYLYDLEIDDSFIYITGWTRSNDFPVQNAPSGTYHGQVDGFLAKFSLDGQQLFFSTFIGGSGVDEIYSMTIDSSKNIYLCGRTQSKDFPQLNGFGLNTSMLSSFVNGFIAKFSSNNQLVYSTYYGGAGSDIIKSITVDRQENIFIAGETESSDFPQKNTVNKIYNGGKDGFFAGFSADGQNLLFSQYLGGSKQEYISTIHVDNMKRIFISGASFSEDFITINPYQEYQEGEDGILVIFSLDLDNDTMSNYWELTYGLNPEFNDTQDDLDNDGFPNLVEYQLGLVPNVNDAFEDKDSDGMPNLWEYQMGLEVTVDDSQEDLDQDGMPNLWEYQMGLVVNLNDASEDKDGDWVSNIVEFQSGTDASEFWSVPLLYSSFPYIVSAPVVYPVLTMIIGMGIPLLLSLTLVNFQKRRLIKRMGAPDYESALKMQKGQFADYKTFIKAQSLHIDTLKEYEFTQELKREEKTNHDSKRD